MSTDPTGTPRPSPSPSPSRSRRRLLVVLGVVLALAVLVTLVVTLRGVDGDGADGGARAGGDAAASSSAPSTSPAPSAEGTTDPTATPTPTQPAAPVPGSVDELPPSLPQVGLTETAAVGDGVTVAVTSVERFEATGTGPGNVSGPALRITLRLTNGTAADVSLDAVTVNAAHGADVTPAPDVNDVSRAPFAGSVAPGASAEGTYTFSVPAGPLDPAVVEVGYRPGAPLVLLVGPVA